MGLRLACPNIHSYQGFSVCPPVASVVGLVGAVTPWDQVEAPA